MASRQRTSRLRHSSERRFLVSLAVFLMICGALLVTLPRRGTPPEEPSRVDGAAVRRALDALHEAETASAENDLSRTESKLQAARQALIDALAR